MGSKRNLKALKAPRVEGLRLDFGQVQTISRIEHGQDGTVQFFDENNTVATPIYCAVDVTHARTNKPPKVISRIPVEPSHIQTQPALAIQRYGNVFAVDTSWKDEVGFSASLWMTGLSIDG